MRGFGFGDLVGLSPLVFNRHSIGTALAVDEAAGRIFRNGLRVTGWFRYKGAQGILKPEQRQDALKALSDGYVGSQNAGKAGVLPGDFDWIGTAMNPADAEMLNNRKLNVEEICRAFGVPPVMVGHIGQGQTMWGSGIEHIVLAFMTTGLRPYLHRIEAAIGRDIIGRADRRTLRASFDVEELLRGDNKGMAEVDQSLANTGILTRNEIRARRGLPPKPGGDTLTVQSALLPIDMLGKVAKLPKEKEVEPGADVALGQPQDGGGQKGRAPFDGEEAKAFDPAKHPRDANGRYIGRGGGLGRITRLVKRALADPKFSDVLDLGSVDGRRFSAAAGRDVDGWRFGLAAQDVRHVRRRHGGREEILRGQLPVTAADYAELPRIFRGGSAQPGQRSGMGLVSIEIDHAIGSVRYHAVLEVRPGKKALAIKTFWKRPGARATKLHAGLTPSLSIRPKTTAASRERRLPQVQHRLQGRPDMDVVIAPMELKFAEHGAELPPGEFKGYGAVFGNTDSHGDVIAAGAFADTLAERAAEGRRHVPLHVMHGVLGGDGLPIGVFKSIAEDAKGLRVHGKISGMDTETGKLHAARLRDGAYGGLSIGFRTVTAVQGKAAGEPKRLITRAKLYEISLVGDPSNAQAIVDEVKARRPSDETRATSAPGTATAAVAKAIALHRACMAGGDSPTADERGQLLDHLQDAHEALTGQRMPDGVKAIRTERDVADLLAEMGLPAERAALLAAEAFKSARDAQPRAASGILAALHQIGESVSDFRLPTFG